MDGFRKYYLEMARKELNLLNTEGLEMIRSLIASFAKEGSEYAAGTSPARLEEIKKAREQEKAAEEAREAWEAEKRRNAPPRYERNETMRIIGRQSTGRILNADPAIKKMYEDLLAAERQAKEHEKGGFTMDMCALGYMAGIRSERKRRKRQGGQVAPVQQEAESRRRHAGGGQG